MYKIHSYNRYAIHAKIFIFCLCVLIVIGASILLGMEGNTPTASYQLNGSIVSQEVFEAFRSKLIVIEKTQNEGWMIDPPMTDGSVRYVGVEQNQEAQHRETGKRYTITTTSSENGLTRYLITELTSSNQ